MENVYRVGLVLIAACPGGTASNLVTHMLKGRVSLSVSLTAFNSFLVLITIPIFINLSASYFLKESYEFQLSFTEMAKNVGLTVIIPIIIGMIVREQAPRLTFKLKKPLRILLPAILIGMFLVGYFTYSSSIHSGIFSSKIVLLIPALLLNLITILLGFSLSKLLGVNAEGQYTIAIEMGLQNSALALYIANSLIGSSDMAFMAIVYGSFSFFTTWGLAFILRRNYFSLNR